MHTRTIPLNEPNAPRARHGRIGRLRATRVIHPFPTLLTVAATAGLAFVAARGAPQASVLLRLLLVMLFAQSAIGVTNDYCDRDLDAATKPWKPIAAGFVRADMAARAAVVLVVAALVLAATLGPGGFALAALGLACGLAYDIRLKRTAFSAVPYMVAIPVLPLWVWLTLGEWRPALWWLLPLGALLGLALHLANTAPDIDGDAAQGVRGLAHRLGPRRSMAAGWIAFAAAIVLSFVIAPLAGYDPVPYALALTAAIACMASSIGLYALRRDALSLRFGFGAIAVGSAVLAIGWLAAVT
jgi:4-hydroxybenzoate polyprenyltransferase